MGHPTDAPAHRGPHPSLLCSGWDQPGPVVDQPVGLDCHLFQRQCGDPKSIAADCSFCPFSVVLHHWSMLLHHFSFMLLCVCVLCALSILFQITMTCIYSNLPLTMPILVSDVWYSHILLVLRIINPNLQCVSCPFLKTSTLYLKNPFSGGNKLGCECPRLLGRILGSQWPRITSLSCASGFCMFWSLFLSCTAGGMAVTMQSINWHCLSVSSLCVWWANL